MTDPAILETFERDGYAIIPNVLPDDLIQRLTEAGDRWLASDHQQMRQTSKLSTDGFRNCVALDDAFLELLAWPAVLPYLVTLLGPEIKLLTSHLIYRDTAPQGTVRTDRAPGWHRDFAQAQRSLGDAHIPRLDIKAAYCLNDLPETARGGTMFVPGSHKLKTKLQFEQGSDPEGAVEPTVRAGDCILFENRTWHAGAANLSEQTRKVVMMGYSYTFIQPIDFDQQPDDLLARAQAMYGDIGLQLLGGLPKPVEFDLNYASKPLREWAQKHDLTPLHLAG